MKSSLAYLSAVFVGFMLISCSSGLSRSAAAKMISERLNAQPGRTAYISASLSGRLVNEEEFQQLPGEIGTMIRLGYFRCKMIPEYIDPNTFNVFRLNRKAHCDVELTEKALGEAEDWEAVETRPDGSLESVKILVGSPEFVEVTGIKQEANDATVTYTWRMKPLNEIGRELIAAEVQEGVAYFQKFDDGWRLR